MRECLPICFMSSLVIFQVILGLEKIERDFLLRGARKNKSHLVNQSTTYMNKSKGLDIRSFSIGKKTLLNREGFMMETMNAGRDGN